jgi:hypothetical protein
MIKRYDRQGHAINQERKALRRAAKSVVGANRSRRRRRAFGVA